MDRGDPHYLAARTDLVREMARCGAFDMEPRTRTEFVVATVRDLRRQHDGLDDTRARELIAEGMKFTYGDANRASAPHSRAADRDRSADLR
jgi:hypothetical protein